MTCCVLDGSIALAWVLPGEGGARVESVLDRVLADGATVPAIWPIEIANVLALAERRRQVTRVYREGALVRLRLLPVAVEDVDVDQIWNEVSQISTTFRLTGYDAMYLEAAIRLELPLASLDAGLCRAAEAAGVVVL